MKVYPSLLSMVLGLMCLLAGSFRADAAKIVFMIGEDEYRTTETLPEFARKELEPLGHKVVFVVADTADKNRFPGLVEALREASLLFLSVRRRTPEVENIQALKAYVASGRPVLGIRTASHAFALLPKAVLSNPALAIWPEFDAEVLGGNYAGHHKGTDKTQVTAAPEALQHPILKDIRVNELSGNGTLYRNTPLSKDAQVLLVGAIPSQPSEPVAWIRGGGDRGGRIFYTSLGHPQDFDNPMFSKLLRNAVEWALEKN